MKSAGRRNLKLPPTIFVSGKGGTGKSTIAIALAHALARVQPTTLIELNPQRPTSSRPGTIREVAEVEYRTLNAREELDAFIERMVPVRMIARRMLRSRNFGFVTTALPGLEAFLMLERIRLIAAAEPARALVIDGPATGGALEMLSVAEGVQRIAPLGTLHRLAHEVKRFIQEGERFAVLLTSRPEGLAIREVIAAAEALDAQHIRCAGVVLNCVADAIFSAAEIAKLTGLEAHQRLAKERRAAALAATRAHRQLFRAGVEVVAVPMLFSATIGRPELETLADALAAGWSLR